jgi:hypothetical protein
MSSVALAESTVLAKTAKGLQEIERHGGSLGLAVRRVLILVDGKRTCSELCGVLGASLDAPRALDLLLDEGFVAPVQAAVPSSPRSALVSMVKSSLGAHASRVLPMFERSEDDPEALMAVLVSATKVVKLTIDERKADNLLAQGNSLLQRYR